MRIEAAASFGFGHAQIIRRVWNEPIDILGASNEHRLEFAMLRADAARGRFPEAPGLHQFERFGQVFFIPAGQIVHAKSQCRHQYSVVCSFRPEAVQRFFHGSFEWTHARMKASLDIAHPAPRALLAKLADELRVPGLAGAAMIESVAGQLYLELIRYLMEVDEPRGTGGLSRRHLRLIDERVARDGAPPGLTELAGLCAMSVRHLTRAFRSSRQRSIGHYIAEQRMQRVNHLLSSRLSVKAIAYKMGFSSPAALSSAYRRAMGETPRDYLQRIRGTSPRALAIRDAPRPSP